MKINFICGRRKTKEGEGYVELTLSDGSLYKYYSTGLVCFTNQWNPKSRTYKEAHPLSEINNTKLKKIKLGVEVYLAKQGVLEKEADLDEIRAIIKGKPQQTNQSFYAYAEKKLNEDMGLALATVTSQKHSLKLLNDFQKGIKLQDIKHSLIEGFDNWMRKLGYVASTRDKVHRNISKYINKAILDDLIPQKQYPYNKFKKEKFTSQKVFLTEAELKKIRDADLAGELATARDQFIIASLTGLSISDLLSLTRKQISEEMIDGEKVRLIRGKRKKSNTTYVIPLFEEAEQLLEKYNYNMPHKSLNRYNILLRRIAKEAGIDKKISSHTARHSFATGALSKNVPIETVSAVLGHTSLRTTQVYAKVVATKVVRDMRGTR